MAHIEIVLDTETTGFSPDSGDRIIEVGAVRLVDRKITGDTFQEYVDPEREVPFGAYKVHGISREDAIQLGKGQVFEGIAQKFIDFIEQGAGPDDEITLIAHNASFDMSFLDFEMKKIGRRPITEKYKVFDTLKYAQTKFGGRASLDRLCDRFGIDNSGRDLHGALLDSQILSEVYLLLTQKQEALIEVETPLQISQLKVDPLNKDLVNRIPKVKGALQSSDPKQKTSKFSHLSIHTDMSIDDSIIKVKDLVKESKKLGFGSVVVTDSSNMFGAIKLYQAAKNEGIKPVFGAEVNILTSNGFSKLILLCKSDMGYKNLMRILSMSYEDEVYQSSEIPTVKGSWLMENSEGLAIVTGGPDSEIGRLILDSKFQEARKIISFFSRITEDFCLSVQRIGRRGESALNELIVQLAIESNVPVVATNEVRYLKREDYKSHNVRLAVSSGRKLEEVEAEPDRCTPEQYLKSSEEMLALFSDAPVIIENTAALSAKCNVEIELGKNYLPDYPTKGGVSESEFLSLEAREGLQERMIQNFGSIDGIDPSKIKEYSDRLEFELSVINTMGFPGYFLIVSDFIKWSKENDIPVGPGRGSGAGSLVAYALKITDLDPLKYELLFERFLNPDRVSMPDFDIDFCMDGRDKVIKYVSDKYGKKSVSQIITYGTMAAKMVVRDVARALGHPYMVGQRISNMISNEPGTKLKENLINSADLAMSYKNDPDVAEIINHSLKLEGLARQTGKHAGGVLIAPGEITEFSPTYSSPDGSGFVSQYDKNDVETAGLVKFDFLGLRTLTIIKNAIDYINLDSANPSVDISRIPLDDQSVFDLLCKGETTAVFQVESKGMKELLKKMKPDSFEDLIALVALYRPGPMESGMVDNFVNRKHGLEEVSYPDPSYQHESLKPILEPTYGIILYQEQVMKIAQALAAYSLGEADMLRRAMGKKKPEEMAKQREVFRKGAASNGVDAGLAMKIFDLVEKFAGYGFNKSHSAAYALISYQTAWLKKHYPSQFMSSVLSSDMNNTDKVVSFIGECKRMGLVVMKPDINSSNAGFTPAGDIEISYGLRSIKGLGDKIVDKLILERKNGEYTSFANFVKRCKPTKREMESAICAGLFDRFGITRKAMIETYAEIAKMAKQEALEEQTPQLGLFGQNELEVESSVTSLAEWDASTLLSNERRTMGLYFSGHPMDEHKLEVGYFTDGQLSDLCEPHADDPDSIVKATKGKKVTVSGVADDVDIRIGKTTNNAYFTLDDGSRQVDVAVYGKLFHSCQNTLQMADSTTTPLVVTGWLKQNKNGQYRLVANEVITLDTARERKKGRIIISLSSSDNRMTKLKSINDTVKSGPMQMYIRQDNELMMLNPGVLINKDLMDSLKETFKSSEIEVHYQDILENKERLSKSDVSKIRSISKATSDSRKKKAAELIEIAELSMN